MLQGQIALVTGASRGIGQAIALALGQAGATVVGTATSDKGAQAIGDYLAEVRATFAEASDALGQDLWTLVTDGPADLLNQTINTQPAMLAADIAAWRVWQAVGGATPALMAGHS
ncbi:MAG: SDR family NAD(P)-dependent oxidoreductase, partial [Candidatus Thermoplasmatota archaeon]|nr:SDR family NAD(P)-dependent oxidoreductase [Candidatus Thermoplasmatota archaeon]